MSTSDENVFFSVSKHEAKKVILANNLKEIKAALKELNVYKNKYTYISGLPDMGDSDYSGLYFFTSKPENLTGNEVSLIGDVPILGKTLALFLYLQFTQPSVPVYASIPNCRLGGWNLWGESSGEDAFLVAERVLIGSRSKAN